jgi:hypothetical protein
VNMPSKKVMTKKHKRMHSRRKTHRKMMAMPAKLWGGASYDSDSLAAKYASCGSADRHNLQTGEANLALINGAGVVPPTQTGGAIATITNGSCPSNGKLLSFKDYTNNVAALLGVPASVPQPSTMLMGGGYSIDPASEQIGGQPARVGYSDCCPPVILEGSLLMGANSGAVCGQQSGGASSCGTNKQQQDGRKHRKGSKRTQKKTKKQRGGDSVPAAFPAESHAGVDGDFSDHGEQLHYDAKQPFWDATAR